MIDSTILIDILKRMILIREFELSVAKIAESGEIQCPVHLYVGQEAIAASVCATLNDQDFAYSTHRSHGHYLAKGGSVNKLMAEIYCRETGCSGGYGGSMHVIDKSVGFMGSSAIVGGTIPIAVGSALHSKIFETSQISVPFFGDGATDEGVFYESINFSVLNKLPVLFVCENNEFATHLPDFMRQSNKNVSERVIGFKILTAQVDGNDPFEVYQAAKQLVEHVRSGKGPALLECRTFRWLSHVGWWDDLDVGFRKKRDVDKWKSKCPINYLSSYLITNGVITQEIYERMTNEIKSNVKESILFAKNCEQPHSISMDN